VAKRGPDSGATCQRCTSLRLECINTGSRRQKSCDACVKVKQRCLAPGEEKPERKRVQTEKGKEKEKEKELEKELSPLTGVGPALESIGTELYRIRAAISDVSFEVKKVSGILSGGWFELRRVADAAAWIASHYGEEEERSSGGEPTAEGEELATEAVEVRDWGVQ
jgi:hypothetical protein